MLSSGTKSFRFGKILDLHNRMIEKTREENKLCNEIWEQLAKGTVSMAFNKRHLKNQPDPSDGLSTRSYDHDILMNILNGRNTRQTDNRKRLLI